MAIYQLYLNQMPHQVYQTPWRGHMKFNDLMGNEMKPELELES